MANKSIEKVLKILSDSFNDRISQLPKEEALLKKQRRIEYHKLLEDAKIIHVPKKIWKYIADVRFLGELTMNNMAPVPYKNQTLLFQPAYRFGSKVSIEYIHVYKYDEEIENLFPKVQELGYVKVPAAFIPIGDIGMQICIRTNKEFPVLISLVIVDFHLFIHQGAKYDKPQWELLSEMRMTGPDFVFGLMCAVGLNTLAFISEPEKAYIWKQKLLRLPKDENKEKRRNKSSSWTKAKIKRTHVIYEEEADGEKGNYTEPSHQVEVPSHIRTLNYCVECEQFIPLRYIPKDICPRCKTEPLKLTQRKSVVENFMKWKDKPARDDKRDVFLSE